jgi:hypothetical protein
MKRLTAEDGTTFTVPDSWEEITLDQFIRICEVDIPEKLRELFVAASALQDPDEDAAKEAEKEYDLINAKITTHDLVKVFPAYYGKLMAIVCEGLSDADIRRVHGELRSEFFDEFLRYVVLSVFYSTPVVPTPEGMVPYIPKGIQSFELEGETFLLPKTLNIYGENVFLGRETAVSFSEASDIDMAFRDLYEKGANRIPMLCSVYCRPEGEEYDEKKVFDREPMFRKLTMDKVWSVFFCIVALSGRYNSFIHEFTRGVVRLMKEEQSAAG